MQPRISVVTLGVGNVSRARRFYEEPCWHAHSASDTNVTLFQANGLVFALYGRKSLANDAHVSLGRGFGSFTLAHNVPTKDEVVPLLALAERAGGRIVKPAQDVFWGG